jgi:hypothetical protein
MEEANEDYTPAHKQDFNVFYEHTQVTKYFLSDRSPAASGARVRTSNTPS